MGLMKRMKNRSCVMKEKRFW